ncbi:MAG: efflux RND transporter periplasmic adaptor subunit [Chloroflexi bacterium]|nr:efflux RND transporter periplasmic adaptor subunit [Chloroflexota bacterium]
MSKQSFYLIPVIIVISFLSACDSLPLNNSNNGDLTASGTIAAQEVKVGNEVGGVVQEISVVEGQTVAEGDVLYVIDDSLLQAQRDQAVAVVGVAEASVATAEAAFEGVQAQYALVVQAARLQNQSVRTNAWNESPLDEFILPAWYFHKTEHIAGAETEVQEAIDDLDIKVENLEKKLQETSNEDLQAAEARVNEARFKLENAERTLEQAKKAKDNDELEDTAQKEYDSALLDLEAAQTEYLRILSSSDEEEILDARAKVAVSQARLDNAQDTLDFLLSGDENLQVKAASSHVSQAEAAVDQAQANLNQAQAGLEVIDVQLEKYTVYAPTSGVVLSLNVEVGEIVTPASTALVIGNLDPVNLTVYVPEDSYGNVYLGQNVEVTVDSFPGEKFIGKIMHIADKAEFTPRNVQTVEGRRSTVYGVDIVVPNPNQKLKPGMPADVTFLNGR